MKLNYLSLKLRQSWNQPTGSQLSTALLSRGGISNALKRFGSAWVLNFLSFSSVKSKKINKYRNNFQSESRLYPDFHLKFLTDDKIMICICKPHEQPRTFTNIEEQQHHTHTNMHTHSAWREGQTWIRFSWCWLKASGRSSQLVSLMSRGMKLRFSGTAS